MYSVCWTEQILGQQLIYKVINSEKRGDLEVIIGGPVK